MIKNIFLISAILGSFQLGYSQNYIPLLNEENHWDVAELSGVEICWYQHANRYRIEGDTIINGDTLVTFNRYPFQTVNGEDPFCPPFMVSNTSLLSSYYLKEDIANQQVYRYIDGSLELLYDFTLEVGEFYQNPGGFPEEMELLSIDTVIYLDGIERRRFVFDYPESDTGTMTYVEGMGGTQGLFNPVTYTISEFGRLMCFAQDGNIVYDFDQCSPWATGISDLYPSGLSMTFSSARNELIVISQLDIGQIDFMVRDLSGRNVFAQSHMILQGETRIPITISTEGIYVLSSKTENGGVSSTMIMFD